jgi:hypothetical protein
MAEEGWLCQEYTKLAERVNRMADMMERLGVTNSGQRGKLFGATWEVSQNHIATWTSDSSLPLTAGEDTYARLRSGELQISTGSGAHMEMTADYMKTWNAAGTNTLDIDFSTGSVTLIGTVYRPDRYKLDAEAIWIENSEDSSRYGLNFSRNIDVDAPAVTSRINMYNTPSSNYLNIDVYGDDDYTESFLLLRAFDNDGPRNGTVLQVHSLPSVGFKVYGDDITTLQWDENGLSLDKIHSIDEISSDGLEIYSSETTWKSETDTFDYPTLNFEHYGDGAINHPWLKLRRARNTIASPNDVQNGDRIGEIVFQGYEGGSFSPAAAIHVDVAAAWGAGDHPGKIEFLTVPDGSAIQYVRLTIHDNGYIQIPTGARLDAGTYLNWDTTEGSGGYGLRDNGGTMQYKNSGGAWTNISGGGGGAHDLGGASHNADTLANLNSKISDATLDDDGDTRPPIAHDLGGAYHSADTLANLNNKISDANLDDDGDTRPPIAHGLGSGYHSNATLAQLNAKISDATLDDEDDTRPPEATDGDDYHLYHNEGPNSLNFRLKYWGTADQVPILHLQKARGSSGSNSNVQSGDSLGRVAFEGYYGGSYRTAALITAKTDGAWGASDYPGKIEFLTVPDGSDTAAVAMSIEEDGAAVFHSKAWLSDNIGLYFGNGNDTTMYYDESGQDRFEVHGASWWMNISYLELENRLNVGTSVFSGDGTPNTNAYGGGVFYGKRSSTGDAYVISDDRILFGSNVYYDGSYKALSNGEGLMLFLEKGSTGLTLYEDETSRTANNTFSWTKTFQISEGKGNILRGLRTGVVGDPTKELEVEGVAWFDEDLSYHSEFSWPGIVEIGFDSAAGEGGQLGLGIDNRGNSAYGTRLNLYQSGTGDGTGSINGLSFIFNGSDARGFMWNYEGMLLKFGGYNGAGYPTLFETNSSGDFIPGSDNAYSLGTDTKEWEEVWAYDTSINHSDRRDKRDIQDESLGLDFIRRLQPRGYRWSHGKRLHHGFIGQEVRDVLEDLGVNTKDAAMYVYAPPYDYIEDVFDDTGKPVKEERHFRGGHYLRYSEFIAPLTRAVQELDKENQVLRGRVEGLEARVKELEGLEDRIKTLEKEANRNIIKWDPSWGVE